MLQLILGFLGSYLGSYLALLGSHLGFYLFAVRQSLSVGCISVVELCPHVSLGFFVSSPTPFCLEHVLSSAGFLLLRLSTQYVVRCPSLDGIPLCVSWYGSCMALFLTLVLPARGSVLQTLFFFFAWAGWDPRCPWLQSRLLACRRRALAPAILAAACGRPALRFGLSRFLSASCLHCGIYMFPLRSCSLIRSVTLCVDCFLDIWFRGVCSSEHLRFIPDWTVFSLSGRILLGNFRFYMSGSHARGNRHRLLVLCFALTSLLGAGAQLCRIQRNFCVCSHSIFVFVPVVVHRVPLSVLRFGSHLLSVLWSLLSRMGSCRGAYICFPQMRL